MLPFRLQQEREIIICECLELPRHGRPKISQCKPVWFFHLLVGRCYKLSTNTAQMHLQNGADNRNRVIETRDHIFFLSRRITKALWLGTLGILEYIDRELWMHGLVICICMDLRKLKQRSLTWLFYIFSGSTTPIGNLRTFLIKLPIDRKSNGRIVLGASSSNGCEQNVPIYANFHGKDITTT